MLSSLAVALARYALVSAKTGAGLIGNPKLGQLLMLQAVLLAVESEWRGGGS